MPETAGTPWWPHPPSARPLPRAREGPGGRATHPVPGGADGVPRWRPPVARAAEGARPPTRGTAVAARRQRGQPKIDDPVGELPQRDHDRAKGEWLPKGRARSNHRMTTSGRGREELTDQAALADARLALHQHNGR